MSSMSISVSSFQTHHRVIHCAAFILFVGVANTFFGESKPKITDATTSVASSALLPTLPWSPASAVDANGVRHKASDYHEQGAWMNDVIHCVVPYYPYLDRKKENRGVGLFRIRIDLKTGNVTNVAVVTSTGFATLDQSVVKALRQWRWTPNTWKQVDMPVRFTLSHARHRGSGVIHRR